METKVLHWLSYALPFVAWTGWVLWGVALVYVRFFQKDKVPNQYIFGKRLFAEFLHQREVENNEAWEFYWNDGTIFEFTTDSAESARKLLEVFDKNAKREGEVSDQDEDFVG